MGKVIHRIELKHLGKKTLDLGYVGENEHTQVVIDCSEVFWEYPDASFSMVVQPPNGAIYPVTLTKRQYDLTWDITASDLVYDGSGQFQLTFTDAGEIIRSAIGSTAVRRSLEATGEAPTPMENWLERANAELDAIETMSEATASDVGKALSPKTVEDGHVTEWQFKTIGSGGGSGTSDYDDLDNKPSINGISLAGNKTTANLGIHEIPSGGSQGQFLGKTSNSNYDIGWISQDKSYANLTNKPKINNVEVIGNKPLSDFGAAAKAETVLDTTLSRGRKSGTTAGTGSIAFGNDVEASGDYSHAEGLATVASASYAHAEGSAMLVGSVNKPTSASGLAAHAEGTATTASGSGSHSEGSKTTASGGQSHAENLDTTASGRASHASGNATIANHKSQFVFGEYNVEDDSSAVGTQRGNYVEIVGKGTSDSSRANARTLDWDGNEVLSGDLTVNKGTSSEVSVGALKSAIQDKADKADTVLTTTFSRGRKANTTVGTGSFAFGFNVTSSSEYSHAEGAKATASGWYTHAEGYETTASATAAHAEGSGTTASSTASHAEGLSTTASGYYSHAEGEGSISYGEASHAEGYETHANGIGSHAEGYDTYARGDYSHAEGNGIGANGECSHAEGVETVANRKSQHVFGEFNIVDSTGANGTVHGTYIEIVGNGDELARSNARTLDWSGNEELAGDLTVNKGTSSEVSVGALKSAITSFTVDEDLLRSEMPGTSTTVTMDSNGNPTSIVHTANSATVRTDTFAWGTGTVTETRTLANGKYITITTNLETLAQTISAVQEVA